MHHGINCGCLCIYGNSAQKNSWKVSKGKGTLKGNLIVERYICEKLKVTKIHLWKI